MLEKIMEIGTEYKWQIGLVLIGCLVGASFLIGGQSVPQQQSVPLTVPSASEESKQTTDESKVAASLQSELVVDVKGAVKSPGIYTLKDGSRVNDAIQIAGGFAETADQKSVNLAQKISDESIIYVAEVGEGVSVVETHQDNQSGPNSSATKNLINLNTATEADLQTISGIGAKRAADIIAYRDTNGGFKTVDDLNNVSGIGDKTMETIRPYVTVE